MNYHFVYRNLPSSKFLEDYAKEKLGRQVARLARPPISVHFTFAKSGHRMQVQCHLVSGDGFEVNASEFHSDIYIAVDKTFQKVCRKLRRHKERVHSHHAPRFEHHNLAVVY